jgi:hypothetical protein
MLIVTQSTPWHLLEVREARIACKNSNQHKIKAGPLQGPRSCGGINARREGLSLRAEIVIREY